MPFSTRTPGWLTAGAANPTVASRASARTFPPKAAPGNGWSVFTPLLVGRSPLRGSEPTRCQQPLDILEPFEQARGNAKTAGSGGGRESNPPASSAGTPVLKFGD